VYQVVVQKKGCTAADRQVGRNIQILRCLRDIDRAAAARHLGCSVRSYTAVEAGERRLSAAALYDLANLLRCRISDFFAQVPGRSPRSVGLPSDPRPSA